MPDNNITIVCEAEGHKVRLYGTYSEQTSDWTLMSFVSGSMEVHDIEVVATKLFPWGIAVGMVQRGIGAEVEE